MFATLIRIPHNLLGVVSSRKSPMRHNEPQVSKRVAGVSSLAAAVVAITGITGTAAAQDGKNYNGSYCKAYFGIETADFVHDVTGIQNVSSQERAVFCPIMVDEEEVTDGLDSVTLHWGGNGEIRCFLESRAQNGTFVQGRELRGPAGEVSLPPEERLGVDEPLGSYSLWCALPPGGTLNTIQIVERD